MLKGMGPQHGYAQLLADIAAGSIGGDQIATDNLQCFAAFTVH